MPAHRITKTYRSRFRKHGGVKAALDRLAAGERIAAIARAMEVSRAFLSFELLRVTPGGKAAVWLARCKASESAAWASYRSASERGQASPAFEWITEHWGPIPGKVDPGEGAARSDAPAPLQAEFSRLHIEAMRKVQNAERGRPTPAALAPWRPPEE